MNKRQLLLEMTRQFYEDCRYIAENNSTQPLDEDGCGLFNTILQEMQAEYPECDLFLKFREIPPRSVKFKDAVLLAGQLHRIANHLTTFQTSTAAPAEEKPARRQPTSESAPAHRSLTPSPGGGKTATGSWPSPGAVTSSAISSTHTPSSSGSASGGGAAGPPSSTRPAEAGQARRDAHDDLHGFLNENEYRVSFKDLE